MQIIDRGNGPALVLIPGLQGRWEYMRPAVDALASSFRVLTFSLGSGDLNGYADDVANVMTRAGVDRAAICGVSFGGLVAVRFAARYSTRCDALILASTPRPLLRLRPRHQFYLRAPWILGPIFFAETPFRLRPELRTAVPDARERRRFSLRALGTAISAPISLSRIAARARMITTEDVTPDCARITAPTLVVTGEPHLDHVVPVEGSSEYLRLIPDAHAVVLERTGHLGSITRPEVFARIIRRFVLDVGEDQRVRPSLDAPQGGPTHGSAPTGKGGPTHGSAPSGRVA
jgi:pimeloyl-ACP methyl ester carboxylesterase